MPSTRKFYRQVIEVEVLSEDEVHFETLEDVAYATREGDCSGKWDVKKQEMIGAYEAASRLKAQGSDPGFFRLDDAGNDVEE